ncbi:type VI secretion protein [Dyella sp. M7H15-1]|uniref:type IV secretion system protein VirB3 n=1 Tax=Dyella sp. M7H15-1 TaxID=2501295 RepID=UPI001005235C|nr:VirB3 family type IV secretion system protein [Dyella sp. M7H15-1]QAU23380.1 type VI secretion protein [Dyella sp. M7H15-1]
MSGPRDENKLRADPLFGGLTRPAMIFSLPIEAAAGIGAGTMVVFLVTKIANLDIMWSIMSLGMGVVLYALARLVCARDPRAFRYVLLQLKTKGAHRTRHYWKSGSYSPLRARKRR